MGLLDSYDEGLMLRQFIWGLQPDLVRSVCLQHPKYIAQAISLPETMELVATASRRPSWKGRTPVNPAKVQGGKNQRGGRSGYFPGHGKSGYRGGTGRRGGRFD